jgi:hypothetical protein
MDDMDDMDDIELVDISCTDLMSASK